MSPDLSFLDMVIIWCIYKLGKVTTSKLSFITKVAEEDINNTIKNLIENGYIVLDHNGNYILTAKAFNSVRSFPDDVKNMLIEIPEEKNIYQESAKVESIPSTIEVKLPEKKGNIGLGAFATFMISLLFAYIPVIGWLASFFGGLIGGLIAKGAGRGALAGFLGIFSAVIIGTLISGWISSYMGFDFWKGAMFGGATTSILLILDFFLAIIGGIIGGALNR